MALEDRYLRLPIWQGTPVASPLKGGLSNESWKVVDDRGAHVLRLGQDFPFHHVDRMREVMTARAAFAAGFGPKVEFDAPGLQVVAFIPGKTWSAKDVAANPDRIADLLREFHAVMPRMVSGPAFLFWPFHVIRDYGRRLLSGQSPFADQVPAYLDLAQRLEATQPALPLIFGHHDLLPANFIEADGKIWLIDYEYAGFGTSLFDLAGVASNAGMNAGETSTLLRTYLGHDPSSEFLRAFDAMSVTSLLREAMWAMVSAGYLTGNDVDYTAYARENLDRMDACLAEYSAKYGAP